MHKGASLVHVHGGGDGEESHEAVHITRPRERDGAPQVPKEHQRYLDALQLGRYCSSL